MLNFRTLPPRFTNPSLGEEEEIDCFCWRAKLMVSSWVDTDCLKTVYKVQRNVKVKSCLPFILLPWQKKDMEVLRGYLSLHQAGDNLTLKWTPNQLINGTLGDCDLEKR